jgi:phosphoribosylanthranilate isomerase
MTWVKICGITNLEDAQTAVEAGADALGFVFYKKSPRNIKPQIASEIAAKLPSRIEKVGVFFEESAENISKIASNSGMTAIQFNADSVSLGKTDCAYCFEQLVQSKPGMKIIPTLSARNNRPEKLAMMWNPEFVFAFLLDSGLAGQPGGTGQPFDWSANQASTEAIQALSNIIVAGGLTPTNVAESMRVLKPWGVDVSSGIEASPGKKDHGKVRAFIQAVRKADQEG